LHKYWEIAKMRLKNQLVWRADVALNLIFTISKIIFAYLLWGIIFGKREIVNGFTFYGMMSYYVVSTFLNQLEKAEGVGKEINKQIRAGTFSKYMVVPLNIEGYFIAWEFGMVFFYVIFGFLAETVWIWIFKIKFQFTTNLFVIFSAILIIIIGLVFMVQLNYYLGILTLKYQGIGTFLMIKDNIISLVTGSFIPLALFPNIITKIMRFLPFYYITYLPSMLLVGYCKDEAIQGIIIILIWCVVLQLVIKYTWNKYIRKYEGVGV